MDRRDRAAARRQRPGIRFHHVCLPADEITVVDGIPVTTMPRTLFDLAAVLDARQVERALNEADFFGSPIRSRSRPPCPPPAPCRGRESPRALAARSAGATRTRSELEERFLHLLDDAGLPRPHGNTLCLGLEVDCAWPEQRLIVELDSRAAHATPAAFETDRERDRVLQTAGWRAVRVTWRQLTEDRVRLVEDVRTLLAA